MESKFTKGPWHVDEVFDTWIMAGDVHVATIASSKDGDYLPANAHLISASPDMYEALEECHTLLENASALSETFDLFIKVKEVLYKARGI